MSKLFCLEVARSTVLDVLGGSRFDRIAATRTTLAVERTVRITRGTQCTPDSLSSRDVWHLAIATGTKTGILVAISTCCFPLRFP